MDYSEAEKYLQSLTDYEKSPGVLYSAANYDLRRMELLLKALGNPHRGRRTIHIAGTKGKGSTAAMISSVLVSAGYGTGRFTSPHLFSWQERLAFNNRPITRKEFASMVTSIAPRANMINVQSRFGRLTTFEVLTAMAFLYFRKKRATLQVLEAGMGGRLDATNVVERPDICIITSLSLDHMQILGGTVAEIAGEKAGIIKPECAVISALQPPPAMKIIEKKCADVNAALLVAGRDISWAHEASSLGCQRFSIQSKLDTYRVSLPLMGDFQMENAALTVAAVEALSKYITIDRTHIVRGLRKVKWPARMQVISRHPLVIIDGAHNPYSIKKLTESLKRHFNYKNVLVIFGSSQDKDIKGMIKEISKLSDHFIITSSNHPRAATAGQISSVLQKSGLHVSVARNAQAALSFALERSGQDDLILATGSLFLAAAIGEALTKRRKII
ncbi:MAG: bifunctional folylpolyglutamate synthase/dihydrofolate synthase [Dehalococcoidia bacterium]|nr:bifunctional folylpolyglutamate synthase/dihydrofolate synthase [Dehalococcoidia bacterium]